MESTNTNSDLLEENEKDIKDITIPEREIIKCKIQSFLLNMVSFEQEAENLKPNYDNLRSKFDFLLSSSKISLGQLEFSAIFRFGIFTYFSDNDANSLDDLLSTELDFTTLIPKLNLNFLNNIGPYFGYTEDYHLYNYGTLHFYLLNKENMILFLYSNLFQYLVINWNENIGFYIQNSIVSSISQSISDYISIPDLYIQLLSTVKPMYFGENDGTALFLQSDSYIIKATTEFLMTIFPEEVEEEDNLDTIFQNDNETIQRTLVNSIEEEVKKQKKEGISELYSLFIQFQTDIGLLIDKVNNNEFYNIGDITNELLLQSILNKNESS